MGKRSQTVEETLEQYLAIQTSRATKQQAEFQQILELKDWLDEVERDGSIHFFTDATDSPIVQIHCEEVNAHVADLFNSSIVKDKQINYKTFTSDGQPSEVIVKLFLDFNWDTVTQTNYQNSRNNDQ